jgi:hypothetical protein
VAWSNIGGLGPHADVIPDPLCRDTSVDCNANDTYINPADGTSILKVGDPAPQTMYFRNVGTTEAPTLPKTAEAPE